ncbi:hypothetical protein PINS_up002964 [Pythium insidiosum]|nr:hypothetical protein PINS_up002964 [Pythium insidiosum]
MVLDRQQLLMMARYHAWSTRRLLLAVEALDDEAYRRDVGLFFQSIHGTLNHLLVTEHEIWFPLIQDGQLPRNIALDAEVELDRHALAAKLQASAECWLPLLERCEDDRLTSDLPFSDRKGNPLRVPFLGTVTHVFNHGTHHRGQITAAMTILGHKCPELDLFYMLLERAATDRSERDQVRAD